ncbi:unnamed protein product [Rotaria magnacalcarata]|uniref:Uncharacterized protein n=1 Tax=Rotaria magnacalcarata TaxID=392030 RepID=A0A816WS51_9BILA|nr:unnamed protein product [Rotaria magnacalcarata]
MPPKILPVVGSNPFSTEQKYQEPWNGRGSREHKILYILMKQIRFPLDYNQNSPIHTSVYQPIVLRPSKTQIVDCVDELVNQFDALLAITNANFNYDNSTYRTACGAINLGSVHSFYATKGNFQTDKFNLNYNGIRRPPKTLQNFVLTMINDMSPIDECDIDCIRVFSVKLASLIYVEIVITAHLVNKTIKLVEEIKNQ